MSSSTDPRFLLFFRNGHLLLLTILVILIAGYSALSSLPILEDPRITHRNPVVLTSVPGAPAERVEALVTEPIEVALREVAEVKEIRSNSREGLSFIAIELEDQVTSATNQEVFSRLRDKIRDVEPDLPATALRPRFIDQRRPIAWTVTVALSSDEPERDLIVMQRQAEVLADRLRDVPGTELAEVFAAPESEVLLEVDRQRLATLGLSIDDIARELAAANPRLPAGVWRSRDNRLLLEVAGAFETVEQIRDVPVSRDGQGRVVLLGDLATLSRGIRTPPETIGLLDNRRAVFIAARMAEGVRIDTWSDGVRDTLERYQAGREGIRFDWVFTQDSYTRDRLGSLASSLIVGAVLVTLVIFLVMGWRAALIVGSAMPLVAALVLFITLLRGGTLHQMSIFGMIIALGLLVDNAIVITDEIQRRMHRGQRPADAVAGALGHLFGPLLASTLTTALAFMPILLLPGNAGDFVGDIGRSVIVAILSSFVLSMSVIAALAGRYLKAVQHGESDQSHWWQTGLLASGGEGALRQRWRDLLHRPVLAIGLAVILPFTGFGLATTLGNEFFPPTDRDMFQVEIWLPETARLSHTGRVVERADAVIRQAAGVEHVYWQIGANFPRVYYNQLRNQDGNAEYAQAVLKVDSPETTDRLVPQLQRQLDEALTDAVVVVQAFGQGPPVDAPVQFEVCGADIATLVSLGKQLQGRFLDHPDMLHSRVTMGPGTPQLEVAVDQAQARRLGLTRADIARQLDAATRGVVATDLLEADQSMPIRLRYRDQERNDLALLEQLPLALPGGGWTPLGSVATTELAAEPAVISRIDRQRCNIMRGYIRAEALPIDVSDAIQTDLEKGDFNLPAGYRLQVGGSVAEESEAVGNLAIYAPVLITLMLTTLVLAFRSFALAALLVSVALLCVGVGLIGTWLMSFPFSFNTILASLGLVGIALNDSIVVLAAIRAQPDARRGETEAVFQAARSTSRHVLSTTLTTMGGFLPLLLLVGGDFWPSLAIVLVVGVAGASSLALVYVPAMYILAQRLTRRLSTAV